MILSIALLVGIGWCVDSISCEVISMALGETIFEQDPKRLLFQFWGGGVMVH